MQALMYVETSTFIKYLVIEKVFLHQQDYMFYFFPKLCLLHAFEFFVFLLACNGFYFFQSISR